MEKSFTGKLDFNDTGTEFLITTVNSMAVFCNTGHEEIKFTKHLKIKRIHTAASTGKAERHLLAAGPAALTQRNLFCFKW